MPHSSDLYKILIPFLLFLGLIIYQADLMDIWHPEEASIVLNHTLHESSSSFDLPDLADDISTPPLATLMNEIGVGIFGSSVWSIRWSSLPAWILFIVLLYQGALFIVGSQAAKYTLIVGLSATPLIVGILSQPISLWIALGNTLAIISLFYLVAIQSPKKWLLYLWMGIVISLGNGSAQALILSLILYVSLPSEYKKNVWSHLKYKRFWILIVLTVGIWVIYMSAMPSGKIYAYNWSAYLKNIVGPGRSNQMLLIFMAWVSGFIVLAPAVVKHVLAGIKRRTGKLYILSVWFIITVIGFTNPMTSLAPLSLFMGLSVFAIQKNYISKKRIRIWAIIQIFTIITFMTVLLRFVNNQFGFWGLLWIVIGGVILLVSVIFYLLMTESKNESLAAQGLLGLNAIFIVFFFIAIFPLFSPSLSVSKVLSGHLNDTNTGSDVVLIDEDLPLDPVLAYYLDRQITNKKILIRSVQDLQPDQYSHVSILGDAHLPSKLINMDTSGMTQERFSYWDHGRMRQKDVWVFMK